MRNLRSLIGIFISIGLLVALAVSPAFAQPRFDPPGLERAIEAQEQHTNALLDIEGVVGTAVGLGTDGEAVVKIYTERSGIGGLPRSLDGIPVSVQVTSKIVAQHHKEGHGVGPPGGGNPTSRFDRPVPIGVSSGSERLIKVNNQFFCTTGTLGARVSGISGVHALSNAHVYAQEGSTTVDEFGLNEPAVAGDAILQPGRADVGCDLRLGDQIGTLYDWQPILLDGSENTIDAAIALTNTNDVGTATPSDGYGTPSSMTTSAFLGQAVQKYGRTTSLTLGTITGINATVNVGYDNGTAKFVGQIIVESPTAFILGGDSGSLLVTDPDRNPVGLLFAGTSDGTLAVANPIDLVLAAFGVTIDWATGPTASVSISPAIQSGQEFPGTTVSYTFTVTNTGDVEDSYTISTSSGWVSSASPLSLTLAPGISTDITVSHTVPPGTSPGISDNGILSADSAATGASASATFTTTARGFAVEITPNSQTDSGAPGDTVNYSYTVTNTGTELDTYTVSTTSSWVSSVNTSTLILAGGASVNVTVSHTIPGNAADGASNLGTLTVASANASASATFATTATVIVTPSNAVTIEKAQYRSRKGILHVRAGSTDATAVLLACTDLGTVCAASSTSFLGELVNGDLKRAISPSPAEVRVDSTLGGFDTRMVDIK